jgi:predicted transcriptional regulator
MSFDRFQSEPYALRRDRDDDLLPSLNPQPFFTVAVPCESCGRPASERYWNPEAELMIGLGCECETPDDLMCPELLGPIAAAKTVGEIVRVCKEHRATCSVCNPKIRQLPAVEPRKKAA